MRLAVNKSFEIREIDLVQEIDVFGLAVSVYDDIEIVAIPALDRDKLLAKECAIHVYKVFKVVDQRQAAVRRKPEHVPLLGRRLYCLRGSFRFRLRFNGSFGRRFSRSFRYGRFRGGGDYLIIGVRKLFAVGGRLRVLGGGGIDRLRRSENGQEQKQHD